MRTILAIGDPHFKVDNSRQTDHLVESTLNLIKDRKPDWVVVMGDVLDRFGSVHLQPFNRAVNWLKDIAAQTRLFVLIGNHDRINADDFLSTVSPFRSLVNWPNTTVVDTVKVEDNFVFAPYVSPGRFDEALLTISETVLDSKRAVFAHQEFKGCKMGAIISEQGDEWSEDRPLVISGHIHEYDRLQPNLIYVGTPYQESFGSNSRKTVSLFTFTETDWSEERIDLNIPRRETITLEINQLAKFTPPQNTILRLVLKGSAEELKIMAKSSQVKELTKMGIKVSFKTEMPSISVIEQPPQPTSSYFEMLMEEAKKKSPLHVELLTHLFSA